jgi:hypothetical protein
MKTGIVLGLIGVFVAGPAVASECPTLHNQVMAQTGTRADAGAHAAKMLAREGEQLHKDGKHAESVKKYEEAAKAAGLNLKRKK